MAYEADIMDSSDTTTDVDDDFRSRESSGSEEKWKKDLDKLEEEHGKIEQMRGGRKWRIRGRRSW